MATGRGDGPNDRDVEEWEDERPRSLLNATWFRVLVVLAVIGAVAAVAVPYVIDMTSAPPPVARVRAAPAKQEPPPQPAAAPPAATATVPAAPPAPAAPAAPAAPPAAPQPDARAAQAPKPEPQKAEPAAAKPDATQPTAKADAPKPAAKRTSARQPDAAKPAPAGSGEFWVQVGAFRDQATAQRLAATLKDKGFNVTQSATTPAAPSDAPASGTRADRYDVVVSGAPAPELVQKLTAKGLSAERTGDGAIIRPSLPLRDAVALSNDLRTEGFKVTVRRVGGGAAPAPAAGTGETLHRVRVGAFPDRAAAREAVQKLEALGYKPFIARGP